jgi:hypothetical protein
VLPLFHAAPHRVEVVVALWAVLLDRGTRLWTLVAALQVRRRVKDGGGRCTAQQPAAAPDLRTSSAVHRAVLMRRCLLLLLLLLLQAPGCAPNPRQD